MMNMMNFPKGPETEAWFNAAFKQTPPPPYCSVDLRYSGYKLAPVDTNLFPAGFNNLHPDNIHHAIESAKTLAVRYVSTCKRIMIVPENHTRNLFYFESLAVLQSIFVEAGFDVRIGSLLPEIHQPHSINLPSGKTLTLEPIIREKDHLKLDNFIPCMILLNHDLSEGVPEILKNISQKIAPPIELGWWSRKKSEHFQYYQEAAHNFASAFNLDPWLINAYFDVCQEVDFETDANQDELIQKVDEVLKQIKKKYQEYKITADPYVVIKADSGTYGMGILTIKNTEQLVRMNHKDRAKMLSTKGNQKIHQVMIQEGVYTVDTVKKNQQSIIAEPVVYLLEQHVIGGFYRTHPDRKENENLNAPGMEFKPIDILGCEHFDKYQIIGRLALLGAARELRGIHQ
jgi:glutamate--cysteine ligase